jgi:drug/metabolite transporter (DMT)-like permease
MSLTAILLLLIAAVAHASWNLMGKKRSPSAAFFLLANLAGVACLSPILLFHADLLPKIPTSVWILLAFTGIAQAVYFIGLSWAYRLGHISIAYPIARAVPVVLVALINLALGHRAQIGTIALIGMALIALGCLLLPMTRFREFRLKNYLHPSSLMALVAALGSTGYSLIDNEALRQLRNHPPTAIGNLEISMLYLMLEELTTSLFLLLYIAFTKFERAQLKSFTRNDAAFAFTAGAFIVIAYGLTLTAMAFVSNVSYVVAFRQISIPLGVTLGILLLKEPAPPPTLTGTTLLLLGLLLVALG